MNKEEKFEESAGLPISLMPPFVQHLVIGKSPHSWKQYVSLGPMLRNT